MSSSFNSHSLNLKAPTILTIAGGVVTVTQAMHIIAAESATSDDLDTATLGYDTLSLDSVDYCPILFLQADTGDTITTKHGTGNYDLTADTDIVLPTDGWVAFIWNNTLSAWQAFAATAL